MFEADVHHLRDKSVLQITLFYFCLSTSDGPRKVPQASPVSSNYSPGPGTLSQNNLLDRFLLLRRTEIPWPWPMCSPKHVSWRWWLGTGEVCRETAGKSSLVGGGVGTGPIRLVPVAQELPLNLSWVSKWQWVRKLKDVKAVAIAVISHWRREAHFEKGQSNCVAISARVQLGVNLGKNSRRNNSRCQHIPRASHNAQMMMKSCVSGQLCYISNWSQQSVLADLE